MADVTRLSLIGGQVVPDPKAEMLRRFEEDVVKMREWLQETGKGGWVLLAYDRDYKDAQPQVHSWCNYHAYDPADAFWLPDMAKTRIYQRAHTE